LLESAPGEATLPEVAINADGVGYAVWSQVANGRTLVMSSRYINGQWQAPLEVSTAVNPGEEAEVPDVVVHPDGEATAIWRQTRANGDAVAASTTQNGQWGTTRFLQTLTGSQISRTLLAADGGGNAIAVWNRVVPGSAPTISAVWSSALRNGVFDNPQQISEGTTNDAERPTVAVDANGHALAVWSQFNGTTQVYSVIARRYTEGVWQNTRVLNPGFQTDAQRPQVAVNAQGRAIVAWLQGDDGEIMARSATDFVNDLWAPLPVDLTGGSAGRLAFPQVSMDALGNSTVIWVQADSNANDAKSSLWAARLGSGPVVVKKVENDDASDARLAKVASEVNGRAMAIWEQSNGTQVGILSSRFDPATGQWGAPEVVTAAGVNGFSAVLDMNDSGRALAAWQQGATPSDIVANVFK
jgi:hypothetical protein